MLFFISLLNLFVTVFNLSNQLLWPVTIDRFTGFFFLENNYPTYLQTTLTILLFLCILIYESIKNVHTYFILLGHDVYGFFHRIPQNFLSILTFHLSIPKKFMLQSLSSELFSILCNNILLWIWKKNTTSLLY